MIRFFRAASPAIAAALALTGTLHAQAASFEIATVKPVNGSFTGGRGIHEDPGRFTARNSTLRRLIACAWSLEDYQIAGGPAWINSEFYNVEAKSAQPASKQEMRLMLQSLLAERFNLAVRHETKEMPVYLLVPAKSGPKFHRNQNVAADAAVRSEPGRLHFKDVPSLAGFLSGFVDRPVLDHTALTGDFDISLEVPRQAPNATSGPPDIAAAMAEFSQNLLPLVEEQLGLKFEARRGTIDIVVVERAGKASASQ